MPLGEMIRPDSRRTAQLKDETYPPIAQHKAVYDQLYADYGRLYGCFGRGENDAMVRLKALKARVQAGT